MQVLEIGKLPSKKFELEVICGAVKGPTPTPGCGSKLKLLSLDDIYTKSINTPLGSQQTFHWRCAHCHTENYLLIASLPSLEIQSKKTYLENLRSDTLLELAQCRPVADRLEFITNIANEHLLDETTLQRVISNPLLWS